MKTITGMGLRDIKCVQTSESPVADKAIVLIHMGIIIPTIYQLLVTTQ